MSFELEMTCNEFRFWRLKLVWCILLMLYIK